MLLPLHLPLSPLIRCSSHSPLSLPTSLKLPSTPRTSLPRPSCFSTPDPIPSSSLTELNRLLILLPPTLHSALQSHPSLPHLIEIVLDLGRPPLARFPSGDFTLSHTPVTTADLTTAISQVGDFAVDNRAGISRTLHRISAIRNRKGSVVGLTCRVGRAVEGSAVGLRDLVEDGGSLLIIGPPGVGKTTIIRDIARMLADDYKKRVMIVDTSNEIGGDGDIPHAGIGSARRLQVPNSSKQHEVLIEAVENHMPQVIVIDEIGTKLEALAASTIAQRGIQLVATAHGVTIENLIMNPSLEMLVGGIQSVTLGDEEASRRRIQKTILERKGPSTFTCGAEIISRTELQVHRSLEATVDALLAGRSPKFEVRRIDPKGSTYEIVTPKEPSNEIHIREDVITTEVNFVKNEKNTINGFIPGSAKIRADRPRSTGEVVHLFIYGISETSVFQAIEQLGMDEVVKPTDNILEADGFLALQSKLKKNSQIQAVAESREIPIFVTKTNSLVQITKAIRAFVNKHAKGLSDFEADDKVNSLEKMDALEEARLAIEQVVIPKGERAQLLPRPPHILSLQMELIKRYKLKCQKVGQEPDVCVCILPDHPENKDKTPPDQVNIGGEFEDLGYSEDIYTNGVTRLPLLPE